ncbi:hypothetical protein C8J57DRAFT_1371909, partial [Mycena rebaudengoi]
MPLRCSFLLRCQSTLSFCFLHHFFASTPAHMEPRPHCPPQNSINLRAVQSFFPSESLAFDRGPRVCTEARGMEITAEDSLVLGPSIGGSLRDPISL